MSASSTVTARQVGESELRGLLGQVERGRDGVRLLLVVAEPTWDGAEVIESPIGPVRVVPGPSPLAVRIAMVDYPDDFLAIITPLSARELGEEVVARAWRRQTLRPSPWDAATSLFRVEQVDPSLRDEKWMVDLLVQLAPPTGYPQPASQILDRDTAWRTLYRHGLGLPGATITTTELLSWAEAPAAVQAVGHLDADARHNVAARLAVDVGPAAEPILELVAAGQVDDLVALGLVLDALWPGPDPVARALVQERYLQQRPVTDPAASDWGSAAVELVRSLGAGSDRASVLQRADQLLAEVDADNTADSDVLERSLLTRLAAVGTALQVALDHGTAASLRESHQAVTRVCAHDLAGRAAGRVAAAEAAFRLVRRHAMPTAPDGAEGIDQHTRQYIEDGGWVDACRYRLAEGETVPELVAAYERIIAVVDDERRQRDRAFAAAVAAEATAAPPSASLDSVRPLRIEQVLDAVVTPLAQHQPVLLLVIDGLSHASAVPMVGDLLDIGWRLHRPTGREVPGVLSALPSRTDCSRSSMLAGRLVSGGQKLERDGFTTHEGLLDATGGQAPRLFHKADVRVSDSEVAAEPREAIANPAQRVVGVVVNGVDDILSGGDQVRLADGIAGVPLLRQLLDAALEAGRTVVITSDHGHILGSSQRVVAPNGGGERFRLADESEVADDEVLLEGPRVLRGEHRIVAAADDGIRYIGVAKYGYHGGATPAEVLCPLLVLASEQAELEGWETVVPAVPEWWDPNQAPVAVDLPAAADGGDVVSSTGSSEPQLSLLEPETPASTPDVASRPAWLDQLLGSSRLADQRRLAGRASLEDHDLAQLVRVLVASGGTASGAALQRTLDVPASRLRGKLEAARTLLDVDGYAVLRVEADGTAVLNLDLLAQQFEIDRPTEGQA